MINRGVKAHFNKIDDLQAEKLKAVCKRKRDECQSCDTI